MNNIEKVIERIKALSAAECEDITNQAAEDCKRLREEYSSKEQEDYWKSINAGTKETEQRLKKLGELALMEAQKQLESLQQEMLDEAFALAAKKLLELPEEKYRESAGMLGLKDGCGTDEIANAYRTVLASEITSALFE